MEDPAACDWSALPGDMLESIATRALMLSGEDFMAFRAVCTSWRAVATKNVFVAKYTKPWPCLPYLMLAEKQGSHEREFYNLFTKEICCKLSGELLLVIRNGAIRENGSSPYGTTKFKVFRIDVTKKKYQEIQSLGDDDAIFVGHSAAFSISTSKFLGAIKPNCIYFTDDCIGDYIIYCLHEYHTDDEEEQDDGEYEEEQNDIETGEETEGEYGDEEAEVNQWVILMVVKAAERTWESIMLKTEALLNDLMRVLRHLVLYAHHCGTWVALSSSSFS